jgi:hypothetical protein
VWNIWTSCPNGTSSNLWHVFLGSSSIPIKDCVSEDFAASTWTSARICTFSIQRNRISIAAKHIGHEDLCRLRMTFSSSLRTRCVSLRLIS